MKKLTEKIIQHIPHDVFSNTDLVSLMEGSGNSRYSVIKRMIADQEILHIRRGLYCLGPKYQRQEIDLYSVAMRIYGPSYVSFESALSYHGWIPEAVRTVTCASQGPAKDFKTPLGLFSYKRVPTAVFYESVDRIKAAGTQVCFMARPFKALLDYIYINKKDWRDLRPVVASLRVDPELFKSLSEQELSAFEENYRYHRVRRFIKGVKKELSRS